MTRKPSWTAEEVAELTRLWAAGTSAFDCGLLLDRTKNSVIGQVHRLELPARKTAPPTRPRKRWPTMRFSPKPKEVPPEVKPPWSAPKVELKVPRLGQEPTGRGMSLLALGREQCRWPIEGLSCCGRQTFPGYPYCEHHAALGRRETPQRRRI